MTPDALAQVMDETWPPAAVRTVGSWLIRVGKDGGQRVSAASARGPVTGDDVAVAEAAMQAIGQPALFMIRETDAALDAELEARGYRRHDPVVAYAAPCADLAQTPPPMTTFTHWPPIAIAVDLWAEGGIGPGRLAVMQRAAGAKTAILARANDRASGVAFVAMSGTTAMLHALEITPPLRRQGSAHNILQAAAVWAQDQGADTLTLVVTRENMPACRLYASFGMHVVGQYHYRQK